MLVIFILFTTLLKLSFSQNNFCQLSPSHTMCKFQGIGPQCGNLLSRGFSEAEKLQIVGMHNNLRSKVASGAEARGQPGPQGPAADMMELVWDEEVASVAQRWAEQCNFGHDQVRDVTRFKVGQNVFEASDFNPGPVNIQQAINGWYEEVVLFNGKQSDSYKFSSGTGHFTQMVWATTRTIGCGTVSYNSGRFIKKYTVCNYGPTGNFLNSPMFKRGPACSACPSGTSCSVENPGLCSAKGRIVGSQPQPTILNQPVIPLVGQPNLGLTPIQPIISLPPPSPPIILPATQSKPPSNDFIKPFIPSEPVVFVSSVDNQAFIPIQAEQGFIVNPQPEVIQEFVVTPRPIQFESLPPQFVSRPQPSFVQVMSGGRPHLDMMGLFRPLFNGRLFG